MGPWQDQGRRFAVAITCIDGRIHQSVTDWARLTFGVDYVDMVTAPGADHVLVRDSRARSAIVADVEVSRRVHGAQQLVLASHTDCAGNPVSDDQHKQMVRAGAAELAADFPGLTIVGVHVDGSGRVVPVGPPPARTSLTA